MNIKLEEFLDQVRECDRIIEEYEDLREELYKRIDELRDAGYTIE